MLYIFFNSDIHSKIKGKKGLTALVSYIKDVRSHVTASLLKRITVQSQLQLP